MPRGDSHKRPIYQEKSILHISVNIIISPPDSICGGYCLNLELILFTGGPALTEEKEITKEEVEHVAWLAHIELTEEEKLKFTEQFNDILNFFKKIDEAPVEEVS